MTAGNPGGAEPPRELHAEAHDAHGALWLLELRVRGALSIWRAGQRIAALPWRPVAHAIHRARTPGGAAAELVALIAHQLGDHMPYAVGDTLGAQVATWLERHWVELRRVVEE